jgi:hypothetical protein
MKGFTAVCLINCSIVAAVGIACWATGSGLPLFGLSLRL